MEAYELYLLTVLINVKGLLHFALPLCLVFSLLGALCVSEMRDNGDELEPIASKITYCLVVVSLISPVLNVFIPTEEQLYMIIGGSYLTTLEGMGDIPPAMVESINLMFDNYLGGDE